MSANVQVPPVFPEPFDFVAVFFSFLRKASSLWKCLSKLGDLFGGNGR